ncbi:MAG: GIY-YIG nuclease family protein [Bacteroidota bacterium]|nr:GIY-YIG nuclease family protein [Bacteroidota bacterium]
MNAFTYKYLGTNNFCSYFHTVSLPCPYALSYFLYILKSKTADKNYIGISANPEKRLGYHNTFEKGFTSRYRPLKIVFIKEYPTKEKAHRAELKLKSWTSKVMLDRFINGELEI